MLEFTDYYTNNCLEKSECEIPALTNETLNLMYPSQSFPFGQWTFSDDCYKEIEKRWHGSS